VAFMDSESGLSLFSGNESAEDTLATAYSLEAGLRDFYLTMMDRVENQEVKSLFSMLSDIESKHQDRVFEEYIKIAKTSISREEFEKTHVADVLEGGLTTEEYADFFMPDWESPKDIMELAMSIEAQALDLYLRVADRTTLPASREALLQIAHEERTHLSSIEKLMAKMLREKT